MSFPKHLPNGKPLRCYFKGKKTKHAFSWIKLLWKGLMETRRTIKKTAEAVFSSG